MTNELRGGAILLAFAVVFGAMGGYLLLPYFDAVGNAEPVDAVVTAAEVTQSTRNGAGVAYFPAVTYRYTYDGREYTGDAVFPGATSVSEDRAEEIVREYAAGTEVTAHVVPDDPTQAYLIEASAPLWYWLLPGAAALSLLGAVSNFRRALAGD